MKIPSRGMMASAVALSSLQDIEPVTFENSFQTLTSSSLSWIDNGLISQAMALSFKNESATERSSDVEAPISSTRLTENEEKWHHQRVVAEALIRRTVHKILDKYSTVSSPEQVEEALRYHSLPYCLRNELVTKYGGNPPATWFDALKQLEDFCMNRIEIDGEQRPDGTKGDVYNKEVLWESVLDHPITSYVPVQCQSCGGHIVPDENGVDDAELGLREEEPLPEEARLVRTGWFRGPRIVPSVFVLDCPKCGALSRWFRSRDPRVILNPRRWGRLCGEQEDLRLDLASYFGFVSVRTIVPLDWDHIWSEFRIIHEDDNFSCSKDSNDFSHNWKQNGDDRNFAARLDEGIGSWTRVLAVSPNPDLCRDVTNNYLSCECDGGLANNQFMEDMNRYRQRVVEARKDFSGNLTQARTVNGYVIERAGLSSLEITSIMKRAAEEYGNREWYEV